MFAEEGVHTSQVCSSYGGKIRLLKTCGCSKWDLWKDSDLLERGSLDNQLFSSAPSAAMCANRTTAPWVHGPYITGRVVHKRQTSRYSWPACTINHTPHSDVMYCTYRSIVPGCRCAVLRRRDAGKWKSVLCVPYWDFYQSVWNMPRFNSDLFLPDVVFGSIAVNWTHDSTDRSWYNSTVLHIEIRTIKVFTYLRTSVIVYMF